MSDRKFPFALAILMAATLTACSGDVEDETVETQRDVYKTLDDCLSDWGDKEMCMQAANAQAQANAAQQQQQQNAGGGSVVPVFIPMFYGPEYDVNKRVAYSKSGNVISPKGNHAFRKTPRLQPSGSYFSKKSAFYTRTTGKNLAPNRKSGLSFEGGSTGNSGKSNSSVFKSSGSRSGVFGGGSRGFSGGG